MTLNPVKTAVLTAILRVGDIRLSLVSRLPDTMLINRGGATLMVDKLINENLMINGDAYITLFTKL